MRKHKVERKPICLIPFQGSLLNEAVHQLVNAEFLSAKKRLQNQEHHTKADVEPCLKSSSVRNQSLTNI